MFSIGIHCTRRCKSWSRKHVLPKHVAQNEAATSTMLEVLARNIIQACHQGQGSHIRITRVLANMEYRLGLVIHAFICSFDPDDISVCNETR